MQLERGGGGCAHLYSRYAISVRCASVICTWWDISCEGCQCCSRRGSVSAASAFSAGGCRQVIVHDYMLQRTEGIIGFVDDKRTNITQGFQPPRTQDSRWAPHTAAEAGYNPQNKSRTELRGRSDRYKYLGLGVFLFSRHALPSARISLVSRGTRGYEALVGTWHIA